MSKYLKDDHFDDENDALPMYFPAPEIFERVSVMIKNHSNSKKHHLSSINQSENESAPNTKK